MPMKEEQTRTNDAPGIDHPVIAVHDLPRAVEAFKALGFQMTAIGYHPWGTCNSLAILERSLIELISVYDATLLGLNQVGDFAFGRTIQNALLEREGVCLVALHSTDIERDQLLFEHRGAKCQGRIDFRRAVYVPGRGRQEAVVSLAIFFDAGLPRLSHFLCQQHKPEFVWAPEWQLHANTARFVSSVTYLADDVETAARRLEALYGTGSAYIQNGVCRVSTAQGEFKVMHLLNARRWYDNIPSDALGLQAIAIGVKVDRISAVAQILGANSIPIFSKENRIVAKPSVGNILVEFHEAS